MQPAQPAAGNRADVCTWASRHHVSDKAVASHRWLLDGMVPPSPGWAVVIHNANDPVPTWRAAAPVCCLELCTGISRVTGLACETY